MECRGTTEFYRQPSNLGNQLHDAKRLGTREFRECVSPVPVRPSDRTCRGIRNSACGCKIFLYKITSDAAPLIGRTEIENVLLRHPPVEPQAKRPIDDDGRSGAINANRLPASIEDRLRSSTICAVAPACNDRSASLSNFSDGGIMRDRLQLPD